MNEILIKYSYKRFNKWYDGTYVYKGDDTDYEIIKDKVNLLCPNSGLKIDYIKINKWLNEKI